MSEITSLSTTTYGEKMENKIILPFLILTKDLIIRPLLNEDKNRVNAAIKECMRELKMWLPWVDGKPSLDDVDDMCDKFYAQARSNEAYHFAVYHNEKFMGMCSFLGTDYSKMTTNLGYWSRLEEDSEERFIEAINAILRYGFEMAGISEFHIPCIVGNYTSELAAKNLNFKLQGIDLIAHKQIKKFMINNITSLPKIDVQWIKDTGEVSGQHIEREEDRNSPKSFLEQNY